MYFKCDSKRVWSGDCAGMPGFRRCIGGAQIQEIGLFARSRRAFVVVLHEDGEGEGRPRQAAGTGGGEGVAAELAAAM